MEQTTNRKRAHALAGPVGLVLLLGALVGAVCGSLTGRLPWRGDWARHVEALARAAGVPLVDAAAVRQAVDTAGALLLDARDASVYAAGHIPGALSWPLRDRDAALAALGSALTPEDSLIVYCDGETCDDALELALFLRSLGFKQVALFAGGWKAWQALDSAKTAAEDSAALPVPSTSGEGAP